MRSNRPILLVEDDNADMMQVRRSLEELNVPNELVHQCSAEDALKYLRNNDNKCPCVILLDLNMPKMSGIDFLAAAKADAELRQIPIIVLTVSNEENDKNKCFDLSAAGFVLKPSSYEDFVKVMKMLDTYWTLSELPYPDV
jgi:CheY-like chemotaxis protein